MTCLGSLGLGLLIAAGTLAIASPQAAAETHPQMTRARKPLLNLSTSPAPTPPPDVAVSFGYKCSWLAIRSSNPQAILQALHLQDVRVCGWSEGVSAAYRGAYFVSPPMGEWVLVVSNSLPGMDSRNSPGQVLPVLQALSRQLDCIVQYFGTHRVVDYHAWALAERGQIRRAFSYEMDRGVTVSEGELTQQERELGLVFPEGGWPREDDVMFLAGRWSIDPSELDETGGKVGLGYLGRR